MKYVQNKVAESHIALPVAMLYSLVVWLLAGMIQGHWWIQFGFFIISAILMTQVNNSNVLIRIYSRIISVSFILLSCTTVFLFPSISGAFLGACFITSMFALFQSYQNPRATGWIYYCFLAFGLGSMADIHILFFLPLYWILMKFFIYAFSWRTFVASLLGVLTPYWFLCAWLLIADADSITWIATHFAALADFQYSLADITLQQLLFVALLIILEVTGTIHYLRNDYQDKIRVRQLYYCFIFIWIFAMTLMVAQPQHYDLCIRIMTVCTSVQIGHFIALTHTKFTNIAFFVILGTILILTVFNLWTSSLIF